MKRLSSEAIAVLGSMETDGNLARLPGVQLERKLYVEVNAALEAIGGKWNRHAKWGSEKGAHVFEADPRDAIDGVVFSGGFTDAKAEPGFFETPCAIVERMMSVAEIGSGMTVLEPSAGAGAIADVVTKYCGARLHCVEVDPARAQLLAERGYAVDCADFLTWPCPGRGFDRVVMNPPFARQQDIDHITHAWGLLAPGGRLVAIASGGVTFRSNRKALAFRGLVEAHGYIEALPAQSFRVSGTDVSTVMVVMHKSAA